MANISNINNFFVVNTAQKRAAIGADLANNNGTPYVGVDFTVVGANSSSPVANLWLSNFTHKSYVLISDNSSNFIIRDPAASSNRLTIASGGNATFAAKVFSTSTVSGDTGTTLVTKDYVDSGDGSSINTILITVAAVGGSNKYFLDGVQQANAVLQPGFTYRFDQSNSSNSSHPLRFSSDSANSSPYTTGVTAVGTPGSSGAYTQIITTQATPVTLYYYCTSHAGMGGAATIRIIQTDGTGYFANDVGIGVTAPSKRLQVSSSATGDLMNILCVNTHDTNGDTASIGFSMVDLNYQKAAVIFERTTTQGRGSLHFATNNVAGNNNVSKGDARMTILSNGDVGIGTTLPTTRLTVTGGYANFTDGTVNVYTGSDGSGGLFGTITNHYQRFITNNVERMRIQNDGNVAIGSTTANKLFNLADPAQGGEALKLHFEASSASDKWAIYTYDRTNGHYANMSLGENAIYIDGSNKNSTFAGNVGIGLTPITGWGASSEVIQLGDGVSDYGALAWNTISGADHFDLMYQSYFDGTNYKYGTNSAAVTAIRQRNGEIFLSTKSGGTANATFTWDDSLKIDNSGNTTITTTSNQGGLTVTSATDNTVVGINNTATGGQAWRLQSTGGSSGLGAGKLFLKVGGTETAGNLISFITDGSGANIKMGIGTTAPGAKLEINDGSTQTELRISVTGDTGYSTINFSDASDINPGQIYYDHGNNLMNFRTNDFDRMRISNVGRVTINTTVVADAMCTIAGNSSNYALNLYADSIYSSVYRYQRFRSGTNIAGGIEGSNQTSVVYNTSSDYRMKKNIKPLKDGLDRVCKLKPVKFDWKLNDETTEGFIAHEVQDIFPDAISGEKDGEEMQGMDYGRITPLLVKAIQELKAEIEILKNK